ncbi:MAG: carboxypeptidase-like regulatory domain-containing protein [Pyrinomonadaceae bacterium]|nr:carboxypeptidase-like regulatory domain-containing protein [Pyrinomonadaceae bacterium]
MKRRQFIQLLIFTSFISLFSQQILACSYGYIPNPFCSFVWKKEVIFKGKAISVAPAENYHFQIVTFEVLENYKGAEAKTFEVRNLVQPYTSCDSFHTIKVGETLKVFANSNDKGEFYNDHDLSSPAEPPNSNYLNQVKTGKTKTEIHGYVRWYSLIKKYKVYAFGNGKTYTTKIAKDGTYTFSNIPAGDYKIKVYCPILLEVLDEKATIGAQNIIFTKLKFERKTRLYYYEYSTSVKEKQCVYDFFTTLRMPQK